jgi:hypothetical protein
MWELLAVVGLGKTQEERLLYRNIGQMAETKTKMHLEFQ